MPAYEIRGTKDGHRIAEQAHSLTKAQWIGAMYVASGYAVEIVEVVPPNKEQQNDEQV